eukprot:CAMPEP_0177728736 /NCGR_PEP_ID=MMETSP0484_2-20121128/21044_1 /TAXON_ID=354590 /ORGANISM="Rhodomonas lens, Strain RHODO" /LENGTH=104 /DNA_ID=CAMNT_0019241537 /DNA_START=3 /DNA_END=318 /DNA_ORIENTATION=-
MTHACWEQGQDRSAADARAPQHRVQEPARRDFHGDPLRCIRTKMAARALPPPPPAEPRPPRPRSESACALRGLVRGARGKAEAQEAKLKSRASSTPSIKFQDCV